MVFVNNKNKSDVLWSVLHKSDIVHTSWHVLVVMPYLTHELQKGWRSIYLSPGLPDLKAPSCFPLSPYCPLMEPHAWDSALICRHRPAAEPKGSWTFTCIFRGKRNCESQIWAAAVLWGKERATSHSLAHDGAPLSRLVRESTWRRQTWVLKCSLKYRGKVKITRVVLKAWRFFVETWTVPTLPLCMCA